MKQYNMHTAKTHLSALVRDAADGEPFAIAINGRPMVKVVPYAGEECALPRMGFLKGQICVPEDFDRMFESEIEDLFGI